jgi:hypothetical protein
VAFALGLDQLHADADVLVVVVVRHEVLHCDSEQDVLVVLRYRVVRVLVGQHDARARLRSVRTLQTLLFQRVALQVL